MFLPRPYGGTERVVSYLTEELVQMGHEVTLFARADSTTQAELVAVSPCALRLIGECVDSLIYHTLLLEQVFQRQEEFDLIHFHIDYVRRQAHGVGIEVIRREGEGEVAVLK